MTEIDTQDGAVESQDSRGLTVYGVEAIHPERVAEVWPTAEPILRVACERMGLCSTGDLLRQLERSHAQLWHVRGAWAVTVIVPFERRRIASLELIAGPLDASRVAEMLEAFDVWARAYQADELRVTSLRGFEACLPGWEATTVWTRAINHHAAPVRETKTIH